MNPLTVRAPRGCGLLLAAALAGCGRSAPPAAPSAPPPAGTSASAGDQVETFTLASYGDDGRTRWQVLGQTADIVGELIALSDVTATTYGPKTTVTLTARDGTFNRQTQRVQLNHAVRAVTSDGTVMTTESLVWDAEQQAALSDVRTTVTRQDLVVQGDGAVGTPQLKRVRFLRRVRVEAAPSTVVTCAGPLVVDYGRSRARFWRAVHVQDPRGEIWADRMDLRWHPTTHRIRDVQCWGHVRVRRPAQESRSARALYRQPDGLMVLIGHPQIMVRETPLVYERPTAP